jgi:hypothetical protein
MIMMDTLIRSIKWIGVSIVFIGANISAIFMGNKASRYYYKLIKVRIYEEDR